MIRIEKKKIAVNYFIKKLLEWGKYKENNDLSTLKVLKLLFFCSAVDSKKDKNSILLDDVFNNFFAMPYGHVESEVYNFIKRNELVYIINNKKAEIKEGVYLNFDNLNTEVKSCLDSSIESLKKINSNLINMNSFELVELSHNWFSWKYYYGVARDKNSYSEKIPSDIIKSEQKILHLG